MGLPNPSRETTFSGTNADREIFIFSIQLTTCRTGNLARLIYTLATCVTIHTVREINNSVCDFVLFWCSVFICLLLI